MTASNDQTMPNKWMLTCAEASYLASSRLDRRLGWRERLSLTLHLLVCRACSHFRRELEAIHEAAAGLGDPDATPWIEIRLPEEVRERMRRELAAATAKSTPSTKDQGSGDDADPRST